MEKKKPYLSVVLAVYNEEKTLGRCLDSLVDLADELVVVDGGSRDKTVEIAQRYHARIIHTDNPPIFHINKQKAVDAARGEWILQMDADEIVIPELATEILKIIKNTQCSGFWIARKNYFIDQWMKKGGMWPDYVIRLFKQGSGHFPCKSVHEQIQIVGTVGHLHHAMIHKPYPSFSEYLRKADTYTSLTKDELLRQHLPITIVSFFSYFIAKSLSTFLSLYIRHRGFQDGWWGFVWAASSGLHFPWAFIKYVKASTNRINT